MHEFSDIHEIGLLYESGANMYAMADSQQRRPQNHLPTTDTKNSYGNVNRTNELPGGSAKTNTPSMPAPSGGFSEGEEVAVKGYGKMSKKQLISLIDKTVDAISDMKSTKRYKQIPSKLAMLNTLIKYIT